MGSAWIRLTPLDELVLSARAATAGAHESLEYIPGAALLGAAARCYRQFGAEALAVFHGGAVRFGNATLEVDGAGGLPMPLSWHERKAGPRAAARGKMSSAAIANYQYTTFERLDSSTLPIQPKQLRAGYVSVRGGVQRPRKLYRTKTAIEPGQRFAADAQLFNYESLAPSSGQRFVAPLQWDDTLSQGTVAQLRRVFEGTTLSVGRSRSAEYGTVLAEWIDAGTTDIIRPPDTERLATLWLLSDLAAEDAAGMPTLAPLPQDLGLPAGTLDLSRSFLRSRRYAPFNSHYAAFESERVVLAQGSVLSYSLSEPWTETHSARVAAGLGLYREAGLGRVAVNHPLLASQQPQFEARAADAVAAGTRAAAAAHPMVTWLERRTSAVDAMELAQINAVRVADEYEQVLATARRYHGLEEGDSIGPVAAQWAEVANRARDHDRERSSQALHKAIFGERGVCGRGRSGWGLEVAPDVTFARWLEQRCVEGETPGAVYPLLVQCIAREIRSRLQRARTRA